MNTKPDSNALDARDAEITFQHKNRDNAVAIIERLKAERDRCRDAKASEVLKREAAEAEIARLRAPPGADLEQQAKAMWEQTDRRAFVRALQQYGDERAREAAENWKAIVLMAGAAARAAAIEEVASMVEFEFLADEIRALSPKPGSGTCAWRPIETAPTDGTFIWVWAAPRDALPGFVEYARYHEDAGWCVDELREVTLWQPAERPPSAPGSET